jgi:putative membrane protein
MAGMLLAGGIVATIAGAIHVWIFLLESVWFSRPSVYQRFGLRSEQDERTVHGFAFNQGFYNLFLAVGVGIGLALVVRSGGQTGADPSLFAGGRAIATFACASMAAAGAILIATDRRFAGAAALQIFPGGLGAVLLFLA